MCFRRNKKAAGTANRQTESIGCPIGFSLKKYPVLIITQGRGRYITKLLLITTTHIIL